MAKFDSQYPVQISPEDGDKILISAGQDGKIMALPFCAIMAYIQKFINHIDDELSLTSLHPVQNKVIAQAIQDIMAQLQPKDDKEIISVLTYSTTAPESATEGDMYIDSENNLLLEYQDNQWGETEAKKNVIYITYDTTHFYIYQHESFMDMTGMPVDNTIYINNLTELDNYTDDGIYRVCMTYRDRRTIMINWYTFVIDRSASRLVTRVIITQTLSNRDGYSKRGKNTNQESWGSWVDFEYANKSDVDYAIKLAKGAY